MSFSSPAKTVTHSAKLRFVVTTVARRSYRSVSRLKSSSPPARYERHEPELIDDEDVDTQEPLLEPRQLARIACFEELAHKIRRASKQHAPLLFGRLDSERNREMGFAGADRPRQNQILRRGDPFAAGECVDLRGAHALSGLKIEGVERLDFGKPGLAEPLAHHRLMAGELLGLEDFVEIVLMRPVCIPGLAGETLKDARDTRQLQGPGVRDDQIAGDGGAHAGTAASQLS